MTKEELMAFLEKHDLTDEAFAQLIGVTRPALDHWLRDRRQIPPWVQRLCAFFDRHPEMIAKY